MNTIDLLQTVAIVGSILISIWQVRAHTAQLKLDSTNAFYDGFNELNMLGIDHPGIFEELNAPYDPEHTFSNRVFWLMGFISNKFEQAFLQYERYGTLSKEDWEGFAPLLLLWLKTPYGRGWWDFNIVAGEQTSEEGYAGHINSLLN